MLALDQSTSATKAVLLDGTGQVLDRATRTHRQIYPQPGWVEHDAEEIWQNTLEVIGEISSRHPDGPESMAGLSLANQRETVVVFERRTGRPLYHALVWQCRRGDPYCAQLRQAGHDPLVHAKTGLKIDTYFSASKICWLIREQPEIGRKLRDGEALVGTIDAYLVYRLTGGKVFATDSTNASRTLLYDIDRQQWDADLCALFDVPMQALPEVRESFAAFGETHAEGRLPRALPICGVMGDSQASLFAQRCFEPGMVKATFGTGTSVLLNVGSQFRLSQKGAVTALAWVRDGQPTYAFEGIINYSAATISWLQNQLGLIQNAAESETLACAIAGNGGVYLVPAFAGLSAPYWNSEARAALIGMTAYTRREHVARAALEAIAYQIRDVLEMMEGETGVAPRNLQADGGPTRNGFLMQFTADLARLDLEVADVSDVSASGAALAGLLGLKRLNSLAELAALPRPARRFSPRMSAQEASALYAGWQAAVKRVL